MKVPDFILPGSAYRGLSMASDRTVILRFDRFQVLIVVFVVGMHFGGLLAEPPSARKFPIKIP